MHNDINDRAAMAEQLAKKKPRRKPPEPAPNGNTSRLAQYMRTNAA